MVRDWQARKGLPVTGVLDQATWALLDPATVALETWKKRPRRDKLMDGVMYLFREQF